MIQQIAVYGVQAFLVFMALAAFSAVVFGIWRVIFAIRNPDGFKQLLDKEAARKQKMDAAAREQIASGKPSWAGRFFASIFTLVGVLIIVHTVWLGWNIAQAKIFWKRDSCTILEKSVNRQRSTGRNSSTFYAPLVKYSYVANGQNYVSTRLDFAGNTYFSEFPAQFVLVFYPVGKSVTCYVNPLNDNDAVLDADFFQLCSFNRMGGIIMCLGLGGFLFYVSRRRQKKSELNLQKSTAATSETQF